ncbi:MAG: T9SS C-terminal target domain-containing protein [Haliscomenobacteraceae bacterium CHB4]|nr:hypothetical protein [Saprospiraceae bacterium]MCE7925285.1 T9SS C-terminal target domain-containing protein [Haliscomenobacteraceae bacterium CHB4]
MNKTVLIFSILLIPFKSYTQTGFNKTYGLEPDLIGSTFMNILLDHDTIVLFGSAYPSNPPIIQGLLFVKMDTLGNVLLQKFYPDPDLDKYAAAPNYEIIKTSDGGYALTGETLIGREGVLVKLSHEGDIEFYKKYPPALTSSYRKVLELENGYLIAGYLQMQDYNIEIFVMKTDKQGNMIWQKTYGEANTIDIMGSIITKDGNHFIIGASKATDPNIPITSAWGRSHIIVIDSLGNVIDDWLGETNKETGIVGLNKLPDGWLYATRTYEVLNPWEWGSYCKIVRRDDNYNLVWEKIVSTTAYYVNVMVDIKPTPDGNWIAAGEWVTPSPSFPPNPDDQYLPAFTYKFTTDGDSLWSRQDTIFWHTADTVCSSPVKTGGVAVLPSGSIITAGYTDRYCTAPVRSFGWVIKMSKDGCMDTLCVTTSLNILPNLKNNITVYPNPTSGIVYMDNCQNCTVEVFNVLGNLVFQQQSQPDQLNLSGLPDGMYVIKMSNGKTNHSKKIIKSQ